MVLPGRTDIVSAVGAFVIGLLGNVYSRLVGGTAFTSMVTGVLFLVPVSIPHSKMAYLSLIPRFLSLELLKAADLLKRSIHLLNSIQLGFRWH